MTDPQNEIEELKKQLKKLDRHVEILRVALKNILNDFDYRQIPKWLDSGDYESDGFYIDSYRVSDIKTLLAERSGACYD